MPATGAPLGTAFGVGIPTSAAVPATDTALSRYIDPISGEYGIDPATGVYQTMPTIRQRVMLALITAKGGISVNPDFGTVLPRKISFRIEQQIKDSVRESLRLMTDTEKSIQINDIIIKRVTQSRVEITVKYSDLTTGENDEVTT